MTDETRLLKCIDCKEMKSTSEFYRSKLSSRGHLYYCKKCHNKRTLRSKQSQEHKEKQKVYYRRYYQEHKEQEAAQGRKWRRENPERLFVLNQRYRTRRADAFVEDIDRELVYDLDDGLCGICKEPVAFEEMTLDHIRPLSKGGKHEYDNVQIAHRVCNSRKYNH